jgi:hypothetical protein
MSPHVPFRSLPHDGPVTGRFASEGVQPALGAALREA